MVWGLGGIVFGHKIPLIIIQGSVNATRYRDEILLSVVAPFFSDTRHWNKTTREDTLHEFTEILYRHAMLTFCYSQLFRRTFISLNIIEMSLLGEYQNAIILRCSAYVSVSQYSCWYIYTCLKFRVPKLSNLLKLRSVFFRLACS